MGEQEDRIYYEDDYDNRFRYTQQPFPALASIDSARVIYLGNTEQAIIKLGFSNLFFDEKPDSTLAHWIMKVKELSRSHSKYSVMPSESSYLLKKVLRSKAHTIRYLQAAENMHTCTPNSLSL